MMNEVKTGYLNLVRKTRILAVSILALSVIVASCIKPQVPVETGPKPVGPGLKVVTSTTLISSAVFEVSGELGEIVSIIPPLKDPLDYKVTAETLKPLDGADLFILLKLEKAKFPDELVRQEGGTDLKVIELDLAGDWLIPPVLLQAVDAIAGTLVQYDPVNKDFYEERSARYKERVRTVEASVNAQLKKFMTERATPELPPPTVICSEKVADFVRWAGLNVVATFGTPEQTPPDKMNEIIEKGRAHEVKMVVDSYQNWKGLGSSAAKSLGADLTFLTRYPGGFKDTETWEKTILRNVQGIIRTYCKT